MELIERDDPSLVSVRGQTSESCSLEPQLIPIVLGVDVHSLQVINIENILLNVMRRMIHIDAMLVV